MFMSLLWHCNFSSKALQILSEKTKLEKIAPGFKVLLFDIKLLFANVPLERTVNITLRHINEDK